jgi:hypothetical protein
VETNQAPAPTGKRVTNLERLRAQGHWIEVEITEDQKVPYFKMPTPELQSAFDEELNKKIKQHLKASGFELLHATRRDHPFHSALLLERVDALARNVTIIDHKRGTFCKLYLPPEKAWKLLTERHDDWVEGMKSFRAVWAKAYQEFQDMRRDEMYWRGTASYNTVLPPNGPALPDEPRPKPVYVKQNHDVILCLRTGIIDLWTRRSLSA